MIALMDFHFKVVKIVQTLTNAFLTLVTAMQSALTPMAVTHVLVNVVLMVTDSHVLMTMNA